MIIKKLFLTIYAEKKWLEEQAKLGYALKRHTGISYEFEQTDKSVFYRYIFLKNGRKSFLELDYKRRDPNCSFIYGNGIVALFKREEAYPEVLSVDELKKNYLKHRQSRHIFRLVAILFLCSSIMRLRVVMIVLWAVLFAYYMLDVNHLDKLIKEEL